MMTQYISYGEWQRAVGKTGPALYKFGEFHLLLQHFSRVKWQSAEGTTGPTAKLWPRYCNTSAVLNKKTQYVQLVLQYKFSKFPHDVTRRELCWITKRIMSNWSHSKIMTKFPHDAATHQLWWITKLNRNNCFRSINLENFHIMSRCISPVNEKAH